MQFLYIKMPILNQAFYQTRQLEDQVDEILKKTGLGSVAGWGDSLGVARPDGSRPVAYTRIDVDVSSLDSARALLQANLPSMGAPTGTEIHYMIDNRHYKDIYLAPGWRLDQPSR